MTATRQQTAARPEGWVLTTTGSETAQVSHVVAGEALFAVGSFQGQTELAGEQLTSAGGQDIFLARLTEAGGVSWLQRFGGSSDDSSDSLALDGEGALVVAGSFTGTADFSGTTLRGEGEGDCFVMKRRQEDGRLLWARRFGGTGSMMCRAVALDGVGDILVTGLFHGTVDLGVGTWSSAGMADTFLMKLSGRDGSPRWARHFGGKGDDVGRGLAVDGSGTVYLSGHFGSTATGEAGVVDFGTGAVTSAGDSDGFLAAFAEDGRCVWTRTFGAVNYDMAKAVVVGRDGHLYLTGLFQRPDVVRQPAQPLFASGGFEGMLASYSVAGEPRWVRRFPAMISGHRLALAPSGELVLAGHFSGALDLGAAGTLRSEGKGDAFVAGFSLEGEARWARRFGGPGADYGYAVAVTAQGGVLLGGIRAASEAFLLKLP
jgi:hypothetical protein